MADDVTKGAAVWNLDFTARRYVYHGRKFQLPCNEPCARAGTATLTRETHTRARASQRRGVCVRTRLPVCCRP